MKRLQELLDKLSTDKYAAMSLQNLHAPNEKDRVVACNMTRSKIEQEYGSFEQLFTTLQNNGITSLRVFERRRNGSAYKPFGSPFDIDLIAKTENDTPAPEKTQAPTAAGPVHALPDFSALNGPGLNAAVLQYQAMDHPRLAGEHAFLKQENETLKKELHEMKLEAIRSENGDKKTASQHELMGTIMGHAPQILTALGALGFSIGPKGNTPAPQASLTGDQLSPAEQRLLENVRGLDDEAVHALSMIATHANNEEFATEVAALLQKYQFKAV